MLKLWQGRRAESRGQAPGAGESGGEAAQAPTPAVSRYTFCRHASCVRGAAALAAAVRREADRLGLALTLDNTLTICDGQCRGGPFVGVPEMALFYRGLRLDEVRPMLQETSLRGRPLFKRLYLDPTVVTDSRVAYERHEGLLVAMEPDSCLLDAATYLFEFNAAESCGKCFPCRLGVQRLSQLLAGLMAGRAAAEDLRELEELTLTMNEAGYCQFAGRITAPVRLALKAAPAEFERHLAAKGCRPGERHLRPRPRE